jgi:DNA-binding NtrC family response regulator
MAEYKILFVDEEEESLENFQYYVHERNSDKAIELIAKVPEDSLDELLEYINSENFDAIVTDHKLNEKKSSIEYDGIDLVRAIQEKKENFPCFILTGWDKDAVENGDDANIVYLKNFEDPEGDTHATFLDKIKNQILKYRKRIKDSEEELLSLIEKSKNEPLIAQEEARLLELDTFIEKSTNAPSALPEHLKGTKNLDELHKMIDSTDKLLAELRELKNDE